MLALGIPEAETESGLGRSTLYDAIRTGKLPARKAGRRTIILRDDLEAFLRGLPSFSEGKTNLAANRKKAAA